MGLVIVMLCGFLIAALVLSTLGVIVLQEAGVAAPSYTENPCA